MKRGRRQGLQTVILKGKRIDITMGTAASSALDAVERNTDLTIQIF